MNRFRTLAAALLLACAPLVHAEPKVLHALLSTGETGLDPAVASDLASLSLLENLFDPMLRYDYLARPVKLVPNTLVAMPTVDAAGTTWTFRLKPGMHFAPDAVFGGKPREVTAADYVYTIQRLYDPALKSPWLFLFEDKLLGDEAYKTRFDYATPIAGLRALDQYTLQIRLKAPDPSLLFYLALPATGVVAREAAEKYGSQLGNHPVGSGPFTLGEWKRSDRITLLANRDYHQRENGTQLPLVDRVEVKIMEEYQSRVLGYLNGEFDYIEQVPESMRDLVLDPASPRPVLKPELAKRGMVLDPFPVLQTYYLWMNMENPVIGGYTPAKVALRRAIAMAYDSAEDIALLKKGLAIPAQTPLPPNVLGYDPAYRSPVRHNLPLARALLERYGYHVGKDGYRTLPGGAPLLLTMHSEPSMVGRLRDELWRKTFQSLALRVEFKTDKKTEIIKASRLGKVMMFETNWVADFPDGDNFYQLLYGPNAGRANYARFNLPAYNVRYEAAQRLSDSPARTKLYNEMADLVHAYTPWVLLTHPISADIRQPWLKNYTRHPVAFTNWRYLDLDPSRRARVATMSKK
ncbi:ABC-type oligopeptide transport system substrate-binding subunit [Pseudoduganella lurida]|uniref:ABC-type oligopeptide transport system substrate-binding subunit n=1 Tax=Pseudoduganella lurida TaxID=1036180 RepID=A0A562QYC5_9BURK|nr:ABC transporter substrate-binding protein [Pseudoduganella lurida]TWI61831.1 ABC-type oligopeptide transport system substrate-binding subunit [Pseudoduganella lurida]